MEDIFRKITKLSLLQEQAATVKAGKTAEILKRNLKAGSKDGRVNNDIHADKAM